MFGLRFPNLVEYHFFVRIAYREKMMLYKAKRDFRAPSTTGLCRIFSLGSAANLGLQPGSSEN
jgi:hypothetical protein